MAWPRLQFVSYPPRCQYVEEETLLETLGLDDSQYYCQAAGLSSSCFPSYKNERTFGRAPREEGLAMIEQVNLTQPEVASGTGGRQFVPTQLTDTPIFWPQLMQHGEVQALGVVEMYAHLPLMPPPVQCQLQGRVIVGKRGQKWVIWPEE